ncbi:MAG: zinc-binding dehydrogenase [Planctomycetota bacterium]|nr:zinc-binding dehydrogenase [Planctomycetota bacterium]
MKAAVLHNPGHIELTETPLPKPGPDEVILRVEAALTCGTDLKAFRRGHPKMEFPTPFGHEFSGIVHQAGPEVELFKEGDPVMGVHTAPCGSCRPCLSGAMNLCQTLFEDFMLGTYAEYVRIPSRIVQQHLFPRPVHLGAEKAAFLEPLACVVHGMATVTLRPTDTVLVIGAGPIGLLFTSLLATRNVEQILVAGHRPERLQIAQQLGATQLIDPQKQDPVETVRSRTDGRGADLVIECTGLPEVWEQALEQVAPAGSILLFGGCPGNTTVRFDTSKLHYEEISLRGCFHYNPEDVLEARSLLVNNHIDVAPLLTGRYPLSDLEHVFELMNSGSGLKYWISP